MESAIVLQKLLTIDGYHLNLYYLLQNFSYLHWTGIAILAKEGTSAKDHTVEMAMLYRLIMYRFHSG